MKHKEPTPDIYKIIYKLSRWKTKSERYFTAFDAQQAFDDFHYAFEIFHVNSNKVHVLDILRYDRFADRWYSCIMNVTNLPPDTIRTKKNHFTMTRPGSSDQH